MTLNSTFRKVDASIFLHCTTLEDGRDRNWPTAAEPGSAAYGCAADGVVTLSQIERNSPITANAEAWGFNDLTCCLIAEIKLIALNVTTPVSEC
jgi:hypothetical protein